MPSIRLPCFFLALALVAGCGRSPSADASRPEGADEAHADEGDHGGDEDAQDQEESGGHDQITLSEAQISAARIEVAPVGAGIGGALSLPAVIATDPTRAAVVATSIGGRVHSLARNVGETVNVGDALAMLESREAAELSAELEAARQQQQLAQATLQREERLYAERVSPESDVLAARTIAKEAQIRVKLAQDRIAATGAAASGTSSAVAIRSPLQGHVVSRSAELGAVVGADTELFRVADLSTVALEIALLPDTASLVGVGDPVHVVAGTRTATGSIAFVSPVIDPHTRQVRATAFLPNADGQWRIGETVDATLPLGAADAITVPRTALQTVEGKPTVFVRTEGGFRAAHVEAGVASGDAVVISSGLQPGDRIAVSNTFVLKAEAGKGEGGHDDD